MNKTCFVSYFIESICVFQLKDVESVVIAKMDATANDSPPQYEVQGYVANEECSCLSLCGRIAKGVCGIVKWLSRTLY